jgi:hypothetical protein
LRIDSPPNVSSMICSNISYTVSGGRILAHSRAKLAKADSKHRFEEIYPPSHPFGGANVGFVESLVPCWRRIFEVGHSLWLRLEHDTATRLRMVANVAKPRISTLTHWSRVLSEVEGWIFWKICEVVWRVGMVWISFMNGMWNLRTSMETWSYLKFPKTENSCC